MTQSTSQPATQLNNITVSFTYANESDTTANLYETQTAYKQPNVWQTTDSGQRKQTSFNSQTTPERSTITTLQSRLTSQTKLYRLLNAFSTKGEKTISKTTLGTTSEITSSSKTASLESTTITSTKFLQDTSTKEQEKTSSRQTSRLC